MVPVNHYRWRCTDCEQAGWPGYCAPLRCYCGHPACTAHASWNRRERTRLAGNAVTPPAARDIVGAVAAALA